MSETILFIHVIWSTNHKRKLFTEEQRTALCNHIVETARSRSIEITEIAGSSDHFHAFIKLHGTQNLAQAIHIIKGESSNWVNTKKLHSRRFRWEEGYAAVSVSPDRKKELVRYLRKHQFQHQTMSYDEELKWFKTGKRP